jgi:hypothetical protein
MELVSSTAANIQVNISFSMYLPVAVKMSVSQQN